jgi:hypothetical protein
MKGVNIFYMVEKAFHFSATAFLFLMVGISVAIIVVLIPFTLVFAFK